SPDRPLCEAVARYHAEYVLKNISDVPAVSTIAAMSLRISEGAGRQSIKTIGNHVAFVTSYEPVTATATFVPEDQPTLLFQNLRRRDARQLPELTVELVYKNVMGACFMVRRAFHVFAPHDDDGTLRAWHTAIESYPARFHVELQQMKRAGFVRATFEDIQNAFDRELTGPEEIPLTVSAIPGGLEAASVSPEYYERFMKSVGATRVIFRDTTCLFDEDA
ncbi:MAG: hypothetical protein U0Q11_27010, partial [Vicinamibacterales bacterium]